MSIRNLEGKVGIVTGASRGIGKAIALGLAGVGARVIVAARTVEERGPLRVLFFRPLMKSKNEEAKQFQYKQTLEMMKVLRIW